MEFLNWFIEPVKNKYAEFSGRAGRKEFWMFVLVYLIIYVILMVIEEALGLIFSLAVLVPSIAITTRRLHDTGMSGWWQLLGLIPIIGWVIVIILTIRPGQPGANQYGQNPDEVAAASDAAAEGGDMMNNMVSETPTHTTETVADVEPDTDSSTETK